MKPLMKFVPVLALGLLAAACGGGSSATGPDAVPTASASIEGTVETASASGPLAALKVSVVGSAISTSTDDSGHFALHGLPAGQVTLHFEGSGIDARLDLSGLSAGQTMNVRIGVSGSQASTRPNSSPSPSASPSPSPSASPSPENEVSLRNRIDSISGSSLQVAGKTVVTDSSTRIRRSGQTIAFSALQVGQTVEVEGQAQANGSILAKSITVEDDTPGNEAEVSFKGNIQSISGSTLLVAGKTVLTDGSTRITRRGDKVAFSTLQVGNKVEVEGTQRTDGSVLAKKISLED
jgi:Domain of unknown function (DUF5666)/Carboxypeptidase regulatory-like domain